MADDDRIPLTKACKGCGQHKPLSAEHWSPQKLGKHGFTSRCRVCFNAAASERRKRADQQERQQAWRDSHKDEVRAYNRQYREAGYKSTAHVAAWRARNIEHVRTQARLKMRKYRAQNPQKYRDAAKRFYSQPHNRQRATANAKQRYRSVTWFNLKSKIAPRVRRLLQGVGARERLRTEAILGYTFHELVRHIELQFTKGMSCDRVLDGSVEIDHIVPVSHFRPTSVESPEFRACWALTNLRPMWADANRQKAGKVLTLL